MEPRILAKRSVEYARRLRKIIFSCLKGMDVVVLEFNTAYKVVGQVHSPARIFRKTDSLPNLRSIHLPRLYDIHGNFFLCRALMKGLLATLVEELLSVAVNLEEIHNVDKNSLPVINT